MSDPVAPLLAQFPGPLRLRSPLWWRRAAVLCVTWQVIGLALVLRALGDLPAKYSDGLLVFGLIAMIVGAIAPWWYCAGALLLDDTGFVYKWPFSQSRGFPWSAVDRFELSKSRRLLGEDYGKLWGNVVFDYAPKQGTLRGKMVTAISGRNLGLLDTVINTGLTPDSLVRLMREWRERALSEPAPHPGAAPAPVAD
jgi:hypothetical protein